MPEVLAVTATRKKPEEPLATVANMVKVKITDTTDAPKESASVQVWLERAHLKHQLYNQIGAAGKSLGCDLTLAMWDLGQALAVLKAKGEKMMEVRKRLDLSDGTVTRAKGLFKACPDRKALEGVTLMKALRQYGVIEMTTHGIQTVTGRLAIERSQPRSKIVLDELDDIIVLWEQHPDEVTGDMLEDTEKKLTNSLKEIAKIKAKLKGDPAAEPADIGLTADELTMVLKVMEDNDRRFDLLTPSAAKAELARRVEDKASGPVAAKIRTLNSGQIQELSKLLPTKSEPLALVKTGKSATTREVANELQLQGFDFRLTAAEVKTVHGVFKQTIGRHFNPKTPSIAKSQIAYRVQQAGKEKLADKIRLLTSDKIVELVPKIVVGPKQSAKIGE